MIMCWSKVDSRFMLAMIMCWSKVDSRFMLAMIMCWSKVQSFHASYDNVLE